MKTMTAYQEEPAVATTGTMQAVILYDDFKLAARATAVLERIVPATDEPLKWEVSPWRLDMLQSPGLSVQAMAEAAGADLLVMALGTDEDAHEEVLAWLERWAQLRNDQHAAVMVYCPAGKTVHPRLLSELKWFTARYGLDYLAGPGNPASVRAARPQPPVAEPAPFALVTRALVPWHWSLYE